MEYWYLIVAGICVLTAGIYFLVNFKNLPTSKQKEKIEKWLLAAVIEAEKQFGSKTGQLKLSFVYDLFVSKFPAVAKFMSFETFSGLVDNALEKMKTLLTGNDAIATYVQGEVK